MTEPKLYNQYISSHKQAYFKVKYFFNEIGISISDSNLL